jgi:penicillin-binding protein 1A
MLQIHFHEHQSVKTYMQFNQLMIKKIIKLSWISFAISLLLLLSIILFVRINLFGLFGELPGLEILENPKNDEASLLLSIDGEVIGSYYREKRTPIEYSDLPEHLINALIATEDERFYKHSGIDFKGTFAIFAYMAQGKKRGSSTLSQQTAKNLFRLRDDDKYQGLLSNNMLVTKIKEWTVAMKIERSYTKKEIITMYLNTVSFGRQTFGIKNAAETYFNVSPKKLSINQSALLVGLLKGPSVYDPIKNPEAAQKRRNTVLSQMHKAGFLEDQSIDELKKWKLGLKYRQFAEKSENAPHLKDFLRPMIRKWANDNNYDLYGGGLRIYTTIDSRAQTMLDNAVSSHMKDLQNQYFKQWKKTKPWKDKDFTIKLAKKSERYKSLQSKGFKEDEILHQMREKVDMTLFQNGEPNAVKMSPLDSIEYMVQILHAGAMSIDAHSGQIRAYVGDIDYTYFKYDHVYQSRRQAGSIFKPFVYAYAMEEKGLTPCSEILDTEVAYPWQGKVWTPRNSNNKYQNAPVTLKYGLANSVNSVAANLMMQCEPSNIASFAKKFGITSEMQAVPSLALGTTDVSLFEMVAAYGVFVNGGNYIKPYALLRIEDKFGNVLEEFRPVAKEVISERTAYYMVELLKAGSEYGTSSALKTNYKIRAEIGGKTGTTQNSADGWFIGISPDWVTGVWVGGQARDIRIIGGQGSTLAMPIWAKYMYSAFAHKDIQIKKTGYTWKNTLPDVNCTATETINHEPSSELEQFLLD